MVRVIVYGQTTIDVTCTTEIINLMIYASIYIYS